MRELFYILLEGLFFLLFAVGGILLAVEGVRFGRKHGVGTDEWSAKKSDEEKSFALKGVITWVGFGVACVVVAFALAYRGLVPRLGDYFDPSSPSQSASPSPSTITEPDKPSSEPPPPEPPKTPQVAFKTPHQPHGVICATYRSRDGMGCVVTDHANKGGYGKQACKILFTVSEEGQAEYEQCPTEDELSELLYRYPFTGKATPYGKSFDMGVAVCDLRTDATVCHDDRGNVLLKLSDAHSTPAVS